MEVRVRIIVDVLSSACATPVRTGSLSLGQYPVQFEIAPSVMVAQEVRDAERWSRFQNAKSGSIPQCNEFRWAAETVVLRQTVNLFPKGNIGGSNPSPPTSCLR